MEKMTTQTEKTKIPEKVKPKEIKGFDTEADINSEKEIAKQLVADTILREKNITKLQEEILRINNTSIEKNNISDKQKEKSFEEMSPGELYNKIQILSVQEMINFLKNQKESKPGALINKLEIIKEEIVNIENNGDTIKPFGDIMENANGTSSSLLMENLNKVLKNNGYKGKILGIFGKNNSVDSFQESLINSLLNEKQKKSFEIVKKEIIKNGENYEKGSTRSAISQGASQRKIGYGKNGIAVKIEDLVKGIK